MHETQYPEDLIIEIIHKFAEVKVDRREWLLLRLVNKLFNKHVLFTIFVLDHRTIKYVRAPFRSLEYFGTRGEWLSPKFTTVYRSWWLQGQLFKLPTREIDSPSQTQFSEPAGGRNWWKRMVGESALLVARYFETNKDDIVNSLILTGFVHDMKSSASTLFWKAQELICDTVACMSAIEDPHVFFKGFESMGFFEKSWGSQSPPPLRAGTFDWSPLDFWYLVTCFLGDINAVHNSLEMVGNVPRNVEDTEKLRFIGLYIAIRQKNGEVVDFLMKCVDISDQNWIYVLCAAAQSGNIAMLQHFLGSQYSERRSQRCLSYAIGRAAENTDTTLRIEMCKLLLKVCEESGSSDSRDLRTKMLTCACRSNDMYFANWIIENGPVDFYNERYRSGRLSQHPLFIAINYNSTDVARFLLKSKFEVQEDAYNWVITEAFYQAGYLGYSDIFMELIPYQTQLSKEKILEYAAGFDHALETVDTLLDLAEVTPLGESRPDKAFDCSKAMEAAVQFQHTSNVKWLLDHGCRTETELVYQLKYIQCAQHGQHGVRKPWTKSKRAIFEDLGQIERLLKAYSNPGVRIECSYECKSPKDLAEVLRLPRPWEYDCACDQVR